MTEYNGINTQSDTSVLTDIEEFYTGGMIPWFHGARFSEHDSRVQVTMLDPDDDNESRLIEYHLTASQIREAFTEAKRRGYNLCCAEEVESDQVGAGCAMDFDIIIQTACYDELVYG